MISQRKDKNGREEYDPPFIIIIILFVIKHANPGIVLLKRPGLVAVNKRFVRDSLRVSGILFTNRCVLQNSGL